MESEIYELYNELNVKKFRVDDPELAELHKMATNHLEEAIVVDNDDSRLKAERDYELEAARERLEDFEEVSSYDKQRLWLE